LLSQKEFFDKDKEPTKTLALFNYLLEIAKEGTRPPIKYYLA
jgi:hypothetical protein